MLSSKIVIIGAGSASFGPTTLATIIRDERLRGCELALVDLNEHSLATVASVTQKMSDAWGADMNIRASTDRRDVLANADFVIVSIEVPPREELWRLDWEIPLKHGLRQPYAENGGPGGLMHACRQIPPFMEIVKDMEALCPDAWLINFSNPLPRITRAVTKYSAIKTVGKCHQIEVGYGIAAVLLRDRYGIEVPDGISLRSDPGNTAVIHTLGAAGRKHINIKSAGLNHFIWLADVRDKETGEDLYPALVSGLGVNGVHIGELPPAVTELLRREAALVEMVVDTAVTGDRSLALQTLLLDPMINDITRARAILDDYLTTFDSYLPQF